MLLSMVKYDLDCFQFSCQLRPILIFLCSSTVKVSPLYQIRIHKVPRNRYKNCLNCWNVNYSFLFPFVVWIDSLLTKSFTVCENEFRKSSNFLRSYGRAGRRFSTAPVGGTSSPAWRRQKPRDPSPQRHRACRAVRAQAQAHEAEEAVTLAEVRKGLLWSTKRSGGSMSARLICAAEPTPFWKCSLVVVPLNWRYVNFSVTARTQARLSECDLSLSFSELATRCFWVCDARGMC